jgi:mono/diheme cytochrome c family protein
MKKVFLVIPVALLTLCFAQSCGNNEPKYGKDSMGKDSSSVSASVNGNVLYETKCMMCHGADGKQGTMGAADLSASKLDHSVVVSIITSGKNSMKGFSPDLNTEQIEAVAKYAESLRK